MIRFEWRQRIREPALGKIKHAQARLQFGIARAYLHPSAKIILRALGGGRSRVPIAALTADAFDDTRERCMAAGMDAFLPKPVSVEALARLIAAQAAT